MIIEEFRRIRQTLWDWCVDYGLGGSTMKSTGIVRQVDNLGRVVLPVELRRHFDINVKDSLEIYVDDEHIILKKYAPSCIFCNNATDTTYFKGKIVCADCIKELEEKQK